MKKVIVLCLSAMALFADYKLLICDGLDNKIIEECIKSYSFSNNLESIYKENKYYDIYSIKKTLTNKLWIDGKPIYRIVFSGNSPSSDRTYISNFKLTEEAENIRVVETNLYRSDFVAPPGDGVDDNWGYQIIPRLTGSDKGKLYFSIGSLAQSEYLNRPVNVVIEYTKITDLSNVNNTNKFKSYIHYSMSKSLNNELDSHEINGLSIQLVDNYKYNNLTNTCESNQ